jgi:hypothetical protein
MARTPNRGELTKKAIERAGIVFGMPADHVLSSLDEEIPL